MRMEGGMRRLIVLLLMQMGPVAAVFAGDGVGVGVTAEVGKQTSTVKIVEDRRRDEIVSKVYKLKYADAAELRPFLLGAVRSVPRGFPPGAVESIRYNDGTSALIISAPAYKFAKSNEGEGIDELIRTLDRPAANSGVASETEVYRPRYRSAAELAVVLRRMRSFPEDRVAVDRQANLLVIKGSPSSRGTMLELLGQADRPLPQTYIKYAVYLFRLDDAVKAGNDYQAWKNGPGAKLFAAGAGSRTSFVNFSPQWSSAYFDFLRSENRAERTVSGGFPAVNGKAVSFVAGRQADSRFRNAELNITLRPRIFAAAVTVDVIAAGRYASGYGAAGPVLGDWRFNTTVSLAREGGSCVIGGPETVSRVDSSSGVPGLRDLPGIGGLFGSASATQVKSRLVIVISSQDGGGLDDEQRQTIKDIEAEFDKTKW